MFLISACLCGVNCKYNGKNNFNEICYKLFQKGDAILICPEVLGNLKTPRTPAELQHSNTEVLNGEGKIITKDNLDVTKEFIIGAKVSLELAKLNNINCAILKDGSPSCGVNYIYDGTFTGNKIRSTGITTKLLLDNGIEVLSEEDLKGEIIDV